VWGTGTENWSFHRTGLLLWRAIPLFPGTCAGIWPRFRLGAWGRGMARGDASLGAPSGARKIAAPCTGLLESAARKGSRFGDSCNVLCLRLSPPSPYSRGRQRVMDAVLDIKRGVRRPFLGLWVREGVDPEPAREGVDKADHNCLSRLARRRATLRTPLAARTAPATTSNPLRTSRRRCRAPRSTWSWASTRALTRRWSTPPAPPACATSRSRTRAARWA
jgi:hypothetical protein